MNAPSASAHRQFSDERQIRDLVTQILAEFKRSMFGLDEVARLCLVAFYCRGHVLLEGNPGLGKTDLVKRLADILGLQFGRIQFTPDLMPADITGTKQPEFSDGGLSQFKFQPGPVLKHQLLLGDEINRATPKTQAAMLEAMAEKQVTVLGEEHKTEQPFMVLATQNPIEHEGTYSLPEAQLDRFMFQIQMPPPTRQSLAEILRKTTTYETHEDADAKLRIDEAAHQEITDWIFSRVRPSPSLEKHIGNLVFAFDGAETQYDGETPKKFRRGCELAQELTHAAIGPRAAIAMMKGAKAWSLLFGETREFASTSDLCGIVAAVLRHRMKLDFSWRAKYAEHAKVAPDHPQLDSLLVLELCCLTAPDMESHDIFHRRRLQQMEAPQ